MMYSSELSRHSPHDAPAAPYLWLPDGGRTESHFRDNNIEKVKSLNHSLRATQLLNGEGLTTCLPTNTCPWPLSTSSTQQRLLILSAL